MNPFLVMKYIAGGSLQQRLDRERPLEVREVNQRPEEIGDNAASAQTGKSSKLAMEIVAALTLP